MTLQLKWYDSDALMLASISPSDYGNKESIEACKNTTRGLRGLFSQKLSLWQDTTDTLAQHETEGIFELTEKECADTGARFDKCMRGLEKVILLCVGDEKTIAAYRQHQADCRSKLSAHRARYEPLKNKMVAKKAEADKAAQAARDAAAAAAAKAVKASSTTVNQYSDALKPFSLGLHHTPTEYKEWKKAMASYFDQNQLNQASNHLQNTYFLRCLDSKTNARISGLIDMTTPVDDLDTGILARLDDMFKDQWPIVMRRVSCVTFKQEAGACPTLLSAKVRTNLQEAEMATITFPEMETFFLIAAVNNLPLRHKLLEMKNPTFDSVTKKISEWVGMENMDRQFRGDNKTAAKVNVVKGAGQKSLPKPPSSIAITPTTLKGRCYICGANNHVKEACTSKGEASCTTCQKKGHYSTVCLQEFLQWKKRSQGKPGAVKQVTADGEESQ